MISSSIPTVPLALKRFITVVPVPDGCVLDGAPGLLMLKGVLAETILPLILPKLDGTYKYDEIRSKFPSIAEDMFHDAISTLNKWGLLEQATRSGLRWTPMEIALEKYHLYSSNRSPGCTVLEQLKDFRIVIHVSSRQQDMVLCRNLCEVARRNGLNDISTVLDQETLPWVSQALALHIQKSHFTDDRDGSGDTTVVWLPIQRTSEFIFIGPVSNDLQACRSTVTASESENTEVCQTESPAEAAIHCLIVWEVLDLVLGAPYALPRDRVRRYRCSDLTNTLLYHLPCDLVEDEIFGSSEPKVGVAEVYNDRVSDEPASLKGPGLDHVYSRALYIGAARIPLPHGECNLDMDIGTSLLRRFTFQSSTVDLRGIAILASFSAGFRNSPDGKRSRWAPTAGNLGSPRLHFRIPNGPSLSGELYTYNPEPHELIDRSTREELFGGNAESVIGGEREEPGFCVFVEARWDVLYPKYGDFGVKLSYLDVGVAMAQLALIGRCIGIRVTPFEMLSRDRFSRRLNIPEMCGCIVVGASLVQDSFGRRNVRTVGVRGARALLRMQDFDHAEMSTITQSLVHSACRDGMEVTRFVREKRLGCCSFEMSPEDVHLPRAQKRMNISTAQVLLRRASVREYVSESIRLQDVATMLRCSSDYDDFEWKDYRALGVELSFKILLRDGNTGNYEISEYCSRHECLHKLRAGLERRYVQRMYIQEEFADAPLTVIICSSISSATRSLGTFGYTNLLTRAGAAAYRIWLCGIGLGLEGTIHAGLKVSVIRQILGEKSFCKDGLVACSLGVSKP